MNFDRGQLNAMHQTLPAELANWQMHVDLDNDGPRITFFNHSVRAEMIVVQPDGILDCAVGKDENHVASVGKAETLQAAIELLKAHVLVES